MATGEATEVREPKLAPAIADGQDLLEFLLKLRREYGDVVRYPTAFGQVHIFNHPDHIHQILHRPNFHRTALMKQVLGEGLLSSDGPYWLGQRRLMQPRFRQNLVLAFAPLINAVTSAALERWEERAGQGEPIDLSAEMTRLTLEIVVKALFSTDIDDADALSDALTTIIEDLGHVGGMVFGLPLRFTPSRNQRFKAACEIVDRFVYDLIRRRRGEQSPPDDLLTFLIAAQAEQPGQAMSDVPLRDEVVTMLVAGHETTALALSWAFYLLSRHPEVERRLCAELDRVLEGRIPTAADLPKLSYTRMVLEETMRLYPPVWTMSRQAKADDEIGGYRIPAQSVVVVSAYVAHRHPDYWENADAFDPERFTPERSAGRAREAYLPFSSGRHTCMGNHFAMVEGIIVLARVLERYRIQLVAGHSVEPYPVLTLRQRYGLLVTLEKRASGISRPPSDTIHAGLEP